jgi:hypothetical protein
MMMSLSVAACVSDHQAIQKTNSHLSFTYKKPSSSRYPASPDLNQPSSVRAPAVATTFLLAGGDEGGSKLTRVVIVTFKQVRPTAGWVVMSWFIQTLVTATHIQISPIFPVGMTFPASGSTMSSSQIGTATPLEK